MSKKYLIVNEAVLPPFYSKVALAKELIASGRVGGVSEAAEMAGISRSTFYKYRDMIDDVNPINSSGLTMLSMTLRNEVGALASLLATVAKYGFNIWTVSSNPPVDSASKIIIVLEAESGSSDLSSLIDLIKEDDNVTELRFHGIF